MTKESIVMSFEKDIRSVCNSGKVEVKENMSVVDGLSMDAPRRSRYYWRRGSSRHRSDINRLQEEARQIKE